MEIFKGVRRLRQAQPNGGEEYKMGVFPFSLFYLPSFLMRMPGEMVRGLA
ncbi:MAG: hypothetical protein WCQ16_03485 [Verrucomicrobiae bacterium]